MTDFEDLTGNKNLAKKDLGFIIKHAEVKELDYIYALEQKNSLRPYSYNMTKELFGAGTVVVAVCGMCYIGYAAINIIFEDAELINIVVDSNERGRGVGGALLAAALRESRKSGAKRVLLEVEDANFAALKLYQKCGFKQISTRERYYEENSAIIMEYSFD